MMRNVVAGFKRSPVLTADASCLSPAIPDPAPERAQAEHRPKKVHETFLRISAQVNRVTRNRLIVVREATSRKETGMMIPYRFLAQILVRSYYVLF